ncbi:FUSC family protein [Streptomyces badius]
MRRPASVPSAEAAEERLAEALVRSRATRDRVADLLLEDVQEHPRQWQLHGALLAEIDRVLAELDIEERTKRLGEELDRRSGEAHARHPRLRALLRRLGRQPV